MLLHILSGYPIGASDHPLILAGKSRYKAVSPASRENLVSRGYGGPVILYDTKGSTSPAITLKFTVTTLLLFYNWLLGARDLVIHQMKSRNEVAQVAQVAQISFIEY